MCQPRTPAQRRTGRGPAWAPRRDAPAPRPAAPLSRTAPQPRGARPGREPVCRAGLGARPTRSRGTSFLHRDLPGERSLPPCAAAESAGCVTSRWRRGTRRPRCRTLSPAHTSRDKAAKPARGHRTPAGAAAAPSPAPPAHLWPGVEVSIWGRATGSRLRGLQPLAPPAPAWDPGKGGRGTDWYPAPEPRGLARPRSDQLGHWGILTLLLCQWHCVDEKGVRGRARVLANIYSEIHNCFAFFFCHLVTI